MYPNVHYSTIHDGQDRGTIELSFDRRLDKEDVVHTYNEILFGHKTRWNTVICDKMDGSWDYHAKLNKSDRKCWETWSYLFVGCKTESINHQRNKETTN